MRFPTFLVALASCAPVPMTSDAEANFPVPPNSPKAVGSALGKGGVTPDDIKRVAHQLEPAELKHKTAAAAAHASADEEDDMKARIAAWQRMVDAENAMRPKASDVEHDRVGLDDWMIADEYDPKLPPLPEYPSGARLSEISEVSPELSAAILKYHPNTLHRLDTIFSEAEFERQMQQIRDQYEAYNRLVKVADQLIKDHRAGIDIEKGEETWKGIVSELKTIMKSPKGEFTAQDRREVNAITRAIKLGTFKSRANILTELAAEDAAKLLRSAHI